MCKWHIESANLNSKANILLILPLDIFKNLRKYFSAIYQQYYNLLFQPSIEDLDKFEVLFMRAEGIYAHGYHSHACKMAVSLAQDLLKSPPDLTLPSNVATEATGAKGKKKRILAASHSLTHKASTTLSHCAFLCTVLSEVPEYHSLAFQVGLPTINRLNHFNRLKFFKIQLIEKTRFCIKLRRFEQKITYF